VPGFDSLEARPMLEVASLPTSMQRGRTHALIRSANCPPEARSLLRASGRSVKTESRVGVEREFPHWTAMAPRPRRNSSEDGIANVLFSSAPTPTSQSFAGDELIPGPAVPSESSDRRAALLAMSAAQHTGRWTVALPSSMRQSAYLAGDEPIAQAALFTPTSEFAHRTRAATFGFGQLRGCFRPGS
jgi:hypothetical protein